MHDKQSCYQQVGLYCKRKVIRLVYTRNCRSLITSSSGAQGPKKSLQWPACIEFPRAAHWNNKHFDVKLCKFLWRSQNNSQAFIAIDMAAMEKVNPSVTGFLVKCDCTLNSINSTSQASSPCTLITQSPRPLVYFLFFQASTTINNTMSENICHVYLFN